MKILVTGSWGFLGRHVQKILRECHQVEDLLFPNSNELDCTKAGQVNDYIDDYRPDVVVHLAALVGGIGANMARPADFWYQNLLMGMNVIEACKDTGVRRIVMTATTCGYPKSPKTIPFIEEEFFDGYPEETNAPYGIAKRCLVAGLDAYMKQYGLRSVSLIPTNLYGPGDNCDSETSHVVPAMIRKAVQARDSGTTLKLWGTGTPTRDFLYVEDAARAVVRAVGEWMCPSMSINLGSGRETSIDELAETVSRIVGFEGRIEYDYSKPDGQPRRVLDSERAATYLRWKAETSLEDGLRKTYDWYVKQMAGARTQ